MESCQSIVLLRQSIIGVCVPVCVCVCVFMQSPAGDCREPPAGADEAEGRAG